jgi:hypothetical protein
MPNIANNVIILLPSAKAFVSAFTDRPPLSFYSSLTVSGNRNAASCIPCAQTDLRQQALADFLAELSVSQVRVNDITNALTETAPVIPPVPTP